MSTTANTLNNAPPIVSLTEGSCACVTQEACTCATPLSSLLPKDRQVIIIGSGVARLEAALRRCTNEDVRAKFSKEAIEYLSIKAGEVHRFASGAPADAINFGNYFEFREVNVRGSSGIKPVLTLRILNEPLRQLFLHDLHLKSYTFELQAMVFRFSDLVESRCVDRIRAFQGPDRHASSSSIDKDVKHPATQREEEEAKEEGAGKKDASMTVHNDHTDDADAQDAWTQQNMCDYSGDAVQTTSYESEDEYEDAFAMEATASAPKAALASASTSASASGVANIPSVLQRVWEELSRQVLHKYDEKMMLLTKTLEAGQAKALVDFEQLGYQIRRGQYLTRGEHGATTVFRVTSTTYTTVQSGIGERAVFRVTGYSFVINARGRVSRQEVMKNVFSFTGGRLLSELGLIPVTPGRQAAALAVRGGRVLEMFGGNEFAHLAYDGDYMYYMPQYQTWLRCHLRGRIMIDVRMAGAVAGGGGRSSQNDDALAKFEVPAERYRDRLFLMLPYVHGYDLHQHKRWGQFHIDHMSPINWNNSAFDRLIMPDLPLDEDDSDCEEEVEEAKKEEATASGGSGGRRRRCTGNPTKEAVQALVENFRDGAQGDLIDGKNSGLNGLLRGPPGLGKTLMAEVTAEHLKRPLLYVSAGSLGLTATQIETQFQRFVDLSKRWGGILLIDEVDSFVERRSANSLERNAIVGCFLYALERQMGIVFMTTNRSAEIDHAVLSRLHFLIDFDVLGKSVRTKIWRNMLTDAHHPNATKLGRNLIRNSSMNGRQLRTLFNIAISLARRDKQDITGITEVHLRAALQLNGRQNNHA